MKRIIILLLVLSTLFVGCAYQTPPLELGEETTGEVTEAEALEEIDTSLITEEDIEIGEMI